MIGFYMFIVFVLMLASIAYLVWLNIEKDKKISTLDSYLKELEREFLRHVQRVDEN